MGRVYKVVDTLVFIICLPFYALALPFYLARRCFPRRCPRCGKRSLRTRNWIRATCVDKTGRRYPDSWAYYSCGTCGARLKVFRNGKTETPSDKEWSAYVTVSHSDERTA